MTESARVAWQYRSQRVSEQAAAAAAAAALDGNGERASIAYQGGSRRGNPTIKKQ